jgi:hypothetical protein
MRYVVLKTSVSETGGLEISGLSEIKQTASGIEFSWFNFAKAKTNCKEPFKCDFLSFEEEEEVVKLLENIQTEGNITYIGVDA